MLRTSTIDTIYDDSTHTYHTIIFITTHIVILSKTLENRGILLKDYFTIMKSSVRSRTAHARACLFESSAFTLNESMVAEAMSRQHEALILRSQAACRRTSLTCGGSDQYQSRVTCCECRKVLVLLYHLVPIGMCSMRWSSAIDGKLLVSSISLKDAFQHASLKPARTRAATHAPRRRRRRAPSQTTLRLSPRCEQ